MIKFHITYPCISCGKGAVKFFFSWKKYKTFLTIYKSCNFSHYKLVFNSFMEISLVFHCSFNLNEAVFLNFFFFTTPQSLLRHFFLIASPPHEVLITLIYYVSVNVWWPSGGLQTIAITKGIFIPQGPTSPLGGDIVSVENTWHKAWDIIHVAFPFWCSKEPLRALSLHNLSRLCTANYLLISLL